LSVLTESDLSLGSDAHTTIKLS